jgi:hypothetical protein
MGIFAKPFEGRGGCRGCGGSGNGKRVKSPSTPASLEPLGLRFDF